MSAAELAPVERRRSSSRSERSRRRHDRAETARSHGSSRGHDVRLVGGRRARAAAVPRDPRQERHERAGRGIGAMEVLEDEDDRPPLAEPTEQAEDALHERSRLAALGRRPPSRGAIGRRPRSSRRPSDGRRRTMSRAAGPRMSARSSTGRSRERRARWPARSVRTARPSPAGAAPPREDGHRLAERRRSARSPRRGTGDPDARRAARAASSAPAAGGVVEHGRESRERVLAPDEPRARVPAGHGRILGPRSRLDDDRRRSPAARRLG